MNTLVRRLLPSAALLLSFLMIRATEMPEFIWLGHGEGPSVADQGNWDNEGATPSGGESFVFGDIAAEDNHEVQIPDFGEGPVYVGNLRFTGTGPLDYAFTGTGEHPSLFIYGDVTVETPGTVTFDSNLMIGLSYSGNDVTVDGGATLRVLGDIYGDDGGGYLTKYGEGTLELGGHNTFSHGFSLHEGTLLIGSSSSLSEGEIEHGPLGSGTLKFYNGSTLTQHSEATIVLHNAIELDCEPGFVTVATPTGSRLTLAGRITGDATIDKTGDGTLILANGDSDFTGGVDVHAGTLQIAAHSNLEENTSALGSADLTMRNGSMLQKAEAAGDLTLYNPIDLVDGNVTVDPGSSSAFALLGEITGDASLTKIGTGYLLLGGNNEGNLAAYSDNRFSGGMKVLAGTLILGSSSHASEGVLLGPVGSGKLLLKNNTALRGAAGAGSLILHNDIELDTAADTTVVVGTDHGDLELAGDITGAASITKEGGYDLTLSGTNAFTGGVSVAAGHLNVDSASGTGTGPVKFTGTTGIVNFNAATHTIGGLAGEADNTDVFLVNAGVLTINQSFDSVYRGRFSSHSEGGTGQLVKAGSGTLTLTNGNSLNGIEGISAVVNGGTLVAGRGDAIGYGGVQVNSGGTFAVASDTVLARPVTVASGGRLAGFGTINDNVTIGGGAILTPGLATNGHRLGTLTIDHLELNSGGILEWEIQNPNSLDGGRDAVQVGYEEPAQTLVINATAGGKFTLKIISLNLSGASGMLSGIDVSQGLYTWTLFSYDALSVPGNANVFDAAAFQLDVSQFNTPVGTGLAAGSFSLTNSGGQILLNFSPVPEPSTYALLALGLGLVGIAAHRRRRA